MKLRKVLTFFLFIVLCLRLGALYVKAQNDVANVVTLYDGVYQDKYLEHQFNFNGNALGNIGNLTISNTGDHKLNVTLLGLEGFVVVSSQNRTIADSPGVIIDVKNGAVSYLPSTWVILDEVGGEKDSVTLLVSGYCIGPYDIDPGTGNLEVLAPTPVDTIDFFADTREIVEYTNGLDYPSSWGELDKIMARSVFYFALTNQDVTPEKLQEVYPNRNIDAMIPFVIDSLEEKGINTEGVTMLTYGLDKEPEDQDTPSSGITGFPFDPRLLIPIVGLLVAGLIIGVRRAIRTPSPATVASTKPGNCQELIDKCKKARDAAEAAEAEAQSAKRKADSANLDYEKSKKPVLEAEKKLRDAQIEPSDEDESWVEMDGRRITSQDLRLRKAASKALWEQYRQGDIDAKALEKAWERLGEHRALEELRKKSREARTAKAEKDLENAKKQAREAEEKLQKAKEEAESARKKSDEAKALADKACEEAVECLEARDKAPTKPTTVKKEDAPEEEPATVEESEETRETTETTETYETTTETYEKPRTRDTLTTETTEALEMHIRQEWEQKRDTKFFGPRLGEPGLKPKTSEKASKESPSVEDASQSRHEYRSTLGGAWAEFWGTISRALKMDK